MFDLYAPVLPQRPGGMCLMSRERKLTYLLRQYLEGRVGCKDPDESAAVRSFFKRYNAAKHSPGGEGIELAIGSGPNPRSVLIYCYVPGSGTVGVLPRLVTDANQRLAMIRHECHASRQVQILPEPTPPTPPTDDEKPRKRGMPPKEPTRLIPGRRA